VRLLRRLHLLSDHRTTKGASSRIVQEDSIIREVNDSRHFNRLYWRIQTRRPHGEHVASRAKEVEGQSAVELRAFPVFARAQYRPDTADKPVSGARGDEVKKVLTWPGLRYDLRQRPPPTLRAGHSSRLWLPENRNLSTLRKALKMMKPGMGSYDRFRAMFKYSSGGKYST
jgi:hypothetical protein